MPALCAFGLAYAPATLADAVTDWDARAATIAPGGPFGQREGAIVDLPMFEAVNSIVHRYRPYVAELPVQSPASPEAAAASAAATALAALRPSVADALKSDLAKYLQGLAADPVAVANGTRLGEAAARQVLAARANDGTADPDTYRPTVQPGQYVPTAPVVAAAWPSGHPFVLERPSQFRPGPPPSLKSREWATDYNEIKSLGSKSSLVRTPAQTETARFWLVTGMQAYHPIARQLITEWHLDLADSARFMALYSMARKSPMHGSGRASISAFRPAWARPWANRWVTTWWRTRCCRANPEGMKRAPRAQGRGAAFRCSICA
jgi:hypothetical protein